MRIRVKVIAGAKNEGVEEKEGMLVVRVRERAEKGRANRAVVKLLEKYFKSRVKIVSGLTSRTKVIEVEEQRA